MPKARSKEPTFDAEPAPRAKAKPGRALAVIAPPERSLMLRMLLHSPKDMVAGLVAFAAVSAIIGNAIFLQAGRHPSPMFGSTVVALPEPVAASPLLPKPRPQEAVRSDAPLDARMLDAKPVDAKPAKGTDARTDKGGDAMGNLVKSTAAPATTGATTRPGHAGRDPVGDMITNRRVAAVQRALTDFGYGQLKPTGTAGSDTQAAIQKFERERKLPVTGQVSDRVVKELAAVTGRSID